MDNINYRGIPTSLFLNGPKLGIVTDPQSLSDVIGVATFTGIATATFPNPTDGVNDGSIEINWYFDGSKIANDEGTQDNTSNASIVGFSSATGTGSTITINGLTIDDNNKEVYFTAEYIPSAYSQPVGSAVTAGTARSTSNVFNGPLQSGIGTITVLPIIEITSQPTDQLVPIEDDAIYTITAQKTPGAGAVGYQWQLNDTDLSDGTTTRTVIDGGTAKITITNNEEIDRVQTIDFSEVSSYDSFVSGRTYTLIANANVTTKLFASGAGGGRSSQRSVSGGAGGSSEGTFTFVKDQTYKLIIGGAGVSAGAGGFSGGGNGGGGHGRGGGGGGFTGLFIDSITQENSIIIAGGGGGGSNDPATGGAGGGLTGNDGSNGGRAGKGGTQSAGGAGSGNGGNAGSALQGGSGAGGGGGGYYGGGGGQEVGGCCADGAGGGGSSYIGGVTDGSTTTGTGGTAVPEVSSLVFGRNSSNGSFRIEFTAASKEVSTIVTGSNTDTLTINAEAEANGTIRCKITATDVQESPVFSNTVSYVVLEPRSLLEIEQYNYTDGTAILSDFNFGDVLTPVCVSVIDEVSRSASEIENSWNSFRSNYPDRPFHLLQPTGYEPDSLKIPQSYTNDPLAYAPITVNRDNGNTSNTSDWFNLMNFASLPSETVVSLAIDNSGSTTTQQVQASLTLFEQRCSVAGLVINQISMEDPDGDGKRNSENWITAHDRELTNSSGLTLSFDSHPGNAICLYAGEKNINVEVDMYGGAQTFGQYEGGYSKIRFTMLRYDEYILTGLFDAVNTPFLYRKGTLIAVVGGAGTRGIALRDFTSANYVQRGGFGGGIGIAGAPGEGRGGNGGERIDAGTLPSNGYFGTRHLDPPSTLTAVPPDTTLTDPQGGGRTLPCPRGVYWRDQGKSPCEDLGTIKFRTPDGTEISNTARISRGYKSGYNIIQTKGLGAASTKLTQGGHGGAGATGGRGGDGAAGGGGGSGYTDGSVTVVQTQLGGSKFLESKIIIRIIT